MTSRGARYWSSGAIPLIAPDMLGDIIVQVSDIAIVVTDLGDMLSVLLNPSQGAPDSLRHWVGRDVREVLTIESVAKLDQRLTELSCAAEGADPPRPIELNHLPDCGFTHPVRYSFHRIGPDGALLMLGRDLAPVAEMQQQLVKAQLALEADYETQREIGTRLRVLLGATTDAMAFVALRTGRIADLNEAAARALGGKVADLRGAPFAARLEGDGVAVVDRLAGMAASDPHGSMPLPIRGADAPVTVTPTLFRAAGERMVLCRLHRDAAPAAGTDLADRLVALHRHGVEGIVFADGDGTILSVNDAFLAMTDRVAPGAVRGSPLSDHLARGQVDMSVILDTARRSGQIRHYAARLIGTGGGEVAVEISAAWLKSQSPPCLALVIRDAARADAVRMPSAATGEDGARSAMELVGSVTLKEIVSDTTDVIEKMCIETAVELTGNNRVAAAEMLGLSRQSLYVKLRKYGILAREE